MSSSPVPSRWLIVALMGATFVNFLGTLALGPFLPQVAEDLETPVALVGQVPALVMLLAALLGLVTGPFADQFGFGRTLMLGVLAATISTLAIGLAPTYGSLLAVSALGAIGRAAIQPSAQATVAAHYPVEAGRRVAMGRVQMGNSGAAIIGIPLLTWIAAIGGWRGAYLVLVALGLCSLAVLWRTLPREASSRASGFRIRDVLASYAPLLRHQPTLGIIVSTLVGSAGAWVVWTYLAAFLVEIHGFTISEIGWVYLFGGGGVMVGTMLASTRIGAAPRRVMIWSRVVGGLLFACAMVPALPAIAVVALVSLAMVLNGMYGVPSLMVLNAESPAGRGTTMTLNSSAMSLGTALGGAAGGLALSLGGYVALGIGALIFQTAASGIIWLARPRSAASVTVVQ
jgi:predicted MFS family arabinose efflux permease